MPETSIFARTFDQARYVSHGDTFILFGKLKYPNSGENRSERIRSSLRVRICDHVEQSRLTRVRKTDQPDIGDCFNNESKVALLARLAKCELPGCLIDRGFKLLVTLAAYTAFEQ